MLNSSFVNSFGNRQHQASNDIFGGPSENASSTSLRIPSNIHEQWKAIIGCSLGGRDQEKSANGRRCIGHGGTIPGSSHSMLVNDRCGISHQCRRVLGRRANKEVRR